MLITLTTDFGFQDAYVAVLKGVILGINPGATLVDVSHNVEPQNVFQAAFLLHTVHAYFPPGTIHLAVVDPGVGTERRPIILVTTSASFVAPDNGLLSYIMEETQPEAGPWEGFTLHQRHLGTGLRAFQLDRPRFWRHPVRHTFHGRDIFAPVAAHLSLGVAPEEMGKPITSLLAFSLPHPHPQPDGSLEGHIQYVDHFGNLISDVRAKDILKGKVTIEISGQAIEEVSTTYGGGKQGELVALVGSCGYLEVALQQGNAAKSLGVGVGARLIIRPIP